MPIITSLSLDSQSANKLTIGLFKYELAPAQKFVSVNHPFCKIFGLTSDKSLQRKRFSQLAVHPHLWDELLEILRKKKTVRSYELHCVRRDGKRVWVALSAILRKSSGKKQWVEGVIQDITEQKHAHEELSAQVDLFQEFLDNMPDAIYFKDKKNRITKVNQFYAKGFKMKPEEIIGKTDFDFFPKEQAKEMFEDDNQILRTNQPVIGKIERTLLPNGSWNAVITTKIPMFDRAGNIMGTMGITRDMTEHANLEKERFDMILNALSVLEKALEMRDPYTYTHTRDVAKIAYAIAKEMKFPAERLTQIKLAAELHDLGKISIPLDILIKPGRLTELEFQLVQRHVDNCYHLIKDIDFSFPLAQIIRQHHERLDGSGYPQGLKAKDILVEARILAVSDVLEAMSSHRPYREALGIKKAMHELKKGSGRKYDSSIVKVAFQLIRKNNGEAFWKNGSFS